MKKSIHYFHLIAPVLVAVLLYFLGDAGLTKPQWGVLGLMLWMLWWWIAECVPMAVTALIPLLFIPMMNAGKLESVAANYGDKFIFLFLGGFILALAIEKHGLHRRIAFGLLDLAGSKKRWILLAVMLSSYLLSMWISNTATALMLLPIAASVAQLFSSDQTQGKFKRALVLGVAYSASIGGMATLIGTPPNVAAAGIVAEQFNASLSFGRWMSIGTPFSLVLLVVVFVILALTHFHRGEKIPGAHHELHQQKLALGTIRSSEKKILLVFSLAVLGWVFQAPISSITGWSWFNDTWIALTAGLSLFFIPAGDSEGSLVTWDDTTQLAWGVLLMFGGGLALSSAFKEVGLLDNMTVLLHGAQGGSPTWFLILLCGVGVLLTAIMSNLAMVTLFVPVVGVLAQQTGADVVAWTIPVTMAASCDFMFPMSTPPNALAYGTGWVKAKDMFTIGFVVNLAAFLLLMVTVWVVM